MYKDSIALAQELQHYASPKSRLTRMIRSGDVIQVRRGLFLDANDRTTSLKSLANILYGPSYISFEYALSFHGLIPERVTALTSAIFNKNKNKTFRTPVGVFYYYYLPVRVYPYGIKREQDNGTSYLVASPEKALLDALYRTKDISSKKALDILLIDDWRIDVHRVMQMDRESLEFLAPLYNRKIHTLFLKWFEDINA
jgi:hypothetical protein